MNDTITYLEPTQFIDSEHPEIMTLVTQLTQNQMTTKEKLVNIFNYVRDKCHYNMYCTSANPDDYIASKILSKKQGYCVQKAILLTALGRALGVPSRLVIAAIKNHKAPQGVIKIMQNDIFFPHAYNQFWVNNHWVSAAATFDQSICKNINVPAVEFNGETDAVLPSYDLDGKPFVEYIDNYGYFADFPFYWIINLLPQYYGYNYTIWFNPIRLK